MLVPLVPVLLAAILLCSSCGEEEGCYPSDVEAVLGAKCLLCHNDDKDFGAPMTLADYIDSQHPAIMEGRLVWEEIAVRIHDPVRPMPPTGLPQLRADELQVLDDWLAAGAGPCRP